MNRIDKCKILIMIICFGIGGLFFEKVDASDEVATLKTEEKTETVPVTEIDLGDYSDTLIVGERQLLSVTVLPFDATETNVLYSSSNESVATINGMGRITAVAMGETTITVSCSDKKASFKLVVQSEDSNTSQVSDIEISDYEEELEVEKTLSLTATVLPTDADYSMVTFRSSNTSVATVNSSGEVKGIAKGNVIIYVSAGNVTKEIPLTVKEVTTSIKLNSDYLVLRKSEEYQLTAIVKPAEADQNVTYRSIDDEIVTVTAEGKVSALNVGNTVIIVSNDDYSETVSVFVNAQSSENTEESVNDAFAEDVIGYEWTVQAQENLIIDSEMLKQLYITGEVLSIIGDGYTLELKGEDIVNYSNLLYSDILLAKTEDGLEFSLNQGESLCGKVTLCLEDVSGKFLYLYNDSKEKYELIQTEDISRLELSKEGKYLITTEELSQSTQMVKYVTVAGVSIMLVLLVGYVILKRKYWFW